MTADTKPKADPALGCCRESRAKHQATMMTRTVLRRKTSGINLPTCCEGSCGFRFIAKVGPMPARLTPMASLTPRAWKKDLLVAAAGDSRRDMLI